MTTMNQLLIRTCPLRSDRTLAYPAQMPRITSIWGAGVVVYATNDGWCGVRLDGETRVDEYPATEVHPV